MRPFFIAVLLLASGGLSAEGTATVDFYGKVLGPDGQPVAARIFVRDAKANAYSASVEQSETNEDGVFLLPRSAKESIDVYVLSEAGAPWSAEEVDPTVPLVVNLERGLETHGVVRAHDTGETISGATVTWIDPFGKMWPTQGLVREVTSDEAGRFLLRGVSGEGLVLAVAPGRAQLAVDTDVTPTPDGLSFSLVPGVRMEGRVLDFNDQPVAGALVRLYSSDLDGEMYSAREYKTGYFAVSETDGSFVFPGVPVSIAWDAGVQHENFLSTRLPTQTLTPGKDIENLVFRIKRGATLKWRCRRPGGGPVGTVYVVFEELDGEVSSRQLTTRDHRADDAVDGLRSLEKIHAGRYRLSFQSNRWKPVTLEMPVKFEEGTIFDAGTLDLVEGARVEGKIIDRRGEPIAGAYLSIRTPDRRFHSRTRSDEDGLFHFTGLGPGPFVIRATKKLFVEFERDDVTANSDVLVLTMTALVRVRGAFTTEDDAMPEKVVARWFDKNRKPGIADGFVGAPKPTETVTLTLEEDGSFESGSFPPGTGEMEFRTRGYKPVRLENVELIPESTTDLDSVLFERGLGMRGVVFGPDGQPVAGAAVSTLLPGMVKMLRKSMQNDPEVTDSDGHFEIYGLEPGTMDLEVTHPEFAAWSKAVALSASENGLLEVVVHLGNGGVIEGHVRDRTGSPVSDAEIVAMLGLFVGEEFSTTTDGDGFYHFDRLPEGRYLIVLEENDESSGLANMTMKNAQVNEGKSTIVNFDDTAKIMLYGVVRRAGEPLAGADIVFIRGDGVTAVTGMRTANADASGMYEVGFDEPGTYQIMISEPGEVFTVMLGTLQIEIPDRERVEQDLNLSKTGVGGRVVDQEGNAIANVKVTVVRKGGDFKWQGMQGSSTTGPTGHYFVSLETPGVYQVSATRTGFAPLQRSLEVMETFLDDVELVLERGSEIRGVVVDDAGRPVPGAKVLSASPGASGIELGLSKSTDAAGHFTVSLREGGAVDLFAWASGYAEARQLSVTAGSFPEDPGVTIVLKRGVVLRVRVVDSDGNPRAGQSVGFLPSDLFLMQLRLDWILPRTTDADGFVLIEGLNPGIYKVLLVGVPGVEPTPIEITGTSDQEVTLIDPGSQ